MICSRPSLTRTILAPEAVRMVMGSSFAKAWEALLSHQVRTSRQFQLRTIFKTDFLKHTTNARHSPGRFPCGAHKNAFPSLRDPRHLVYICGTRCLPRKGLMTRGGGLCLLGWASQESSFSQKLSPMKTHPGPRRPSRGPHRSCRAGHAWHPHRTFSCRAAHGRGLC